MNDNFNNDKWTEKAVWIKKEPLSSDAVLDDVRAILNGIVNPIQYMQRIAKESGSSIDGRAAVELANDVSYYRALAKEALEKLASISA